MMVIDRQVHFNDALCSHLTVSHDKADWTENHLYVTPSFQKSKERVCAGQGGFQSV